MLAEWIIAAAVGAVLTLLAWKLPDILKHFAARQTSCDSEVQRIFRDQPPGIPPMREEGVGEP